MYCGGAVVSVGLSVSHDSAEYKSDQSGTNPSFRKRVPSPSLVPVLPPPPPSPPAAAAPPLRRIEFFGRGDGSGVFSFMEPVHKGRSAGLGARG